MAAEKSPPAVSFSLNAPEEITGVSADGAFVRRVSRDLAMTVPAVKKSRDLIAGTLGTLPPRVHNARRQTVDNRLMEQPESDVPRSVTLARTFEDLLMFRRSWWRIVDFGSDGFPRSIRRLEPETVLVRQDARVFYSPDGAAQGQALVHIPDELLIRFDSPNPALLEAGARAIRTAIALDQTASRYSDEPLPLGYFSPREGSGDADRAEILKILDEWEASRRERSWGYVGAALEANTLQWNPEQIQLADQRQHAVLEISRIAGLDPEDLGVHTTSRTYRNAEQRRMDLIDFALTPYVAAFEDRLSMNDVTPRGQRVLLDLSGFLRADTLTRMQTYEIGRRVGVYTDERIAELEHVPTATPQPAPTMHRDQADDDTRLRVVNLHAEPAQLAFDTPETAAAFRVDRPTRTISGLAVPYGPVAKSAGRKWRFTRGSVQIPADLTRIKLLRDHNPYAAVGYASRAEDTPAGLDVSFKIARGDAGDEVLSLAEDRVLDGFSVGVDFEDGDTFEADPSDESISLVRQSTWRETSITAMPAFDAARVSSVAATRKAEAMNPRTDPQPGQTDPQPGQTDPQATEPVGPDLAEFTAGLTESIQTAVSAAVEQITAPQQGQREVIPAGRAVITYEPPVYDLIPSHGSPSFVRDTMNRKDDRASRERLEKFLSQQHDIAAKASAAGVTFDASTTSVSEIIPPGYRPELYVPQLFQGRPLVSALSRGSLTDATPFTVPRFGSSSGMTADHVEGTNPTDGTIDMELVTVTPGAVSGLFEMTREVVDASNPAIDAIALQAMRESYSQQTEAKVYVELNGANGQGGTLTNGRAASGAWVHTTSGEGAELLDGIRLQFARFPFHRFSFVDGVRLSQEGTEQLAAAKDNSGRPLLPPLAPQNAAGGTAGLGTMTQGFNIDGQAAMPAWSMIGNEVHDNTTGAGDADVLTLNSADAWYWESATLQFRFEERRGPAGIDLALFGYTATRLLRPAGLHAVRHEVVTA